MWFSLGVAIGCFVLGLLPPYNFGSVILLLLWGINFGFFTVGLWEKYIRKQKV
jgi:purine-cytosine permease-like protein